ncbi:4-(cytidine 5'-diphospho)-2-C-methyl-D-erythritol kinase, partial [Rhodosalinus sediminis]|uniref:4-(cytidine 5'-diphospho)-2-C-methyl-D-erythritol kinase n=1 Tax=Rhodosalinus sediminis TaxID=1940533 RepID=UPI002354A716
MTPAEARAPAKVNLALHVTGRRADGYHTLDSLVVFADAADVVRVRPAETPSLRVTGPRAEGVPTDASNLVMRAAAAMGVAAAIELEKHLPAAGGIGGGSSDAAATLRALAAMTGRAPPADLAALGADVPVCMAPGPARMRGIGEVVEPLAALPALDAVLVNPGVAVPTPQV